MTDSHEPQDVTASNAVDAEPTAAPQPEPAEVVGSDPVLVGETAVELARAAAVEVGAGQVGGHLNARDAQSTGGARIVMHAFAAEVPGYVGWHWAVSLVRAAGTELATVDEVVLLPGDDALLAPAWVPWEERVRPGDLGPGDLLPPQPDDPRLAPAYLLSDDPAVESVAFELGLGRERVMSHEGRLQAADRWHAGDFGPESAMARQAPAQCGTCGFFLPLAGSLQAGFGVCGNDIPEADGNVVSVEYGCGAHSQVVSEATPRGDSAELVYDDGDDIVLEPASS